MGTIVQKATVREKAIALTTGIRRPEIDAVARSGGFVALNRLSTTLGHVCAVLSAHLRNADDDAERRVLDRLTTVIGDVFVAVRLSRFEVQSRKERASAQTTPSQISEGPVNDGLVDPDLETVHRAQWAMLERCFQFLVEWEHVELLTASDAARMCRDLERLATDAERSCTTACAVLECCREA